MTRTAHPTDAPALHFERCYRALSARDARFDGQFFVTVTTTGIYCRPSCPARTPAPENVAFVPTAAAAVAGGFRACRRCLPDATPGSPRWNTGADLASRAMRLISDGMVDRAGVDGLAGALGYTPRHLSRVLRAELGAGPLALARAHRATTARILLVNTAMPVSDVAFAAGFSSIRQFNDTLRDTYDRSPTELRRRYAGRSAPAGPLTLRLPLRTPYDVAWTVRGFASHAVPGLEHVDGTTVRRTLRLPHGPALVALTLSADRRLAPLVVAAPGIRIPGGANGHETLIRAILGQQISVAAARTRLGVLVAELGEPAPWQSPAYPETPGMLFPSPEAIVAAGPGAIRGPRRLARAVVAASEAIASGRMEPHAGAEASKFRTELLALEGVGPWTADQVVLRVTGDPDVLPHGDLVIAQAAADLGIDLGNTGTWRPWRSYAAMHLWRHRLTSSDTSTDQGENP